MPRPAQPISFPTLERRRCGGPQKPLPSPPLSAWFSDTLMRSLGGAIGIATCGTILNDRTNLHLLRIAEHFYSANTEFMKLLHSLQARFVQAWGIRSAAKRRPSREFGSSRIARLKCRLSRMPIWQSRSVSRFPCSWYPSCARLWPLAWQHGRQRLQNNGCVMAGSVWS